MDFFIPVESSNVQHFGAARTNGNPDAKDGLFLRPVPPWSGRQAPLQIPPKGRVIRQA